MDTFALALLGSTAASALSSGAGYAASQRAAGTQAQAAQQSGMLGYIAQQQALEQARQAAEKGAAASREFYNKGAGDVREFYGKGRQDIQDYYGRGESALTDYYNRGRGDILGQAQLGEDIGREFYGRGVAAQEPYTTTGAGATNQLAALFAPGGEYTREPTLEELKMDPGYAFRTQEGLRALSALQGASGLRGSGAAMKAGIRYGQEAGSQEYQNAYNRFMANRLAATQGLENIAGRGASAAGTVSQLAGTTGGQLSGNRFTTGSNLGQAALTTGGNIGQGAFNTGANLGQAATTAGANLGNLASNAGGAISGAYTGLASPQMTALAATNPYAAAIENVGQARASGYVGGASALQSALNTPVNAMMAYGMADRFAPQNRSSIYAPQQVGYLSGGPTYAPGYSPGFMGVPTFGAPRVG
jgi:hypothetical protein